MGTGGEQREGWEGVGRTCDVAGAAGDYRLSTTFSAKRADTRPIFLLQTCTERHIEGRPSCRSSPISPLHADGTPRRSMWR